MTQIQVLDARNMVMPEPLLATLAALDSLQSGACLRLLVERDPLLLYPLLEERGFRYSRLGSGASGWEVLIWRAGDSGAECCR
jgi:uncharacterized protein (DUF2249 family)